MADIVTELITGFFQELSNPIALIGILGVLIGCILRTVYPFARKVWLGVFVVSDFQKTYIGLLVAAFSTSGVFYFAVGPLTEDWLVEIILGLLLGLAGNEVFNAIYKYVIAFFKEGKNSRLPA